MVGHCTNLACIQFLHLSAYHWVSNIDGTCRGLYWDLHAVASQRCWLIAWSAAGLPHNSRIFQAEMQATKKARRLNYDHVHGMFEATMHLISPSSTNTILMTTKLSYIDHVRKRTHTNPCLRPLVDYLVKEPRFRSRVHILDIHTAASSVLQAVEIPEEEISRIYQHSPLVSTRIVLVENINSRLISQIGEALDIDPLFFAGHVITDFKDIENAPLPPSLATLPSIAAEKGYLNIHFQQVLDLGSSATFKNVAYSLKSDSNTPRNVRRLPSLFGRQLGLGRGCCSMLVKRLKNTSICKSIPSYSLSLFLVLTIF